MLCACVNYEPESNVSAIKRPVYYDAVAKQWIARRIERPQEAYITEFAGPQFYNYYYGTNYHKGYIVCYSVQESDDYGKLKKPHLYLFLFDGEYIRFTDHQEDYYFGNNKIRDTCKSAARGEHYISHEAD